MKLRGIAGAAVAVLLAALSPEADAAGIRCRSDPAVVLSNGAIVDLSADIDADLWDVQTVDYVMHVPAGVKVVAVVRTPNWPTTKETFRVIADAPAGTYDTTTVVVTKNCNSAVQANLLVKTLTNVLGYKSAGGLSGQPIRVAIKAGSLLGGLGL